MYEYGWYSKLKDENGLFNSRGKSEDGVYICKQIKKGDDILRLFRKFSSLSEFYTYMLDVKKEKRCFFEVILGENYQKPYFDIDITTFLPDMGKRLIESIKESILKTDSRILPEQILVFSSHGKNKISYHIVINGWCVPNHYTNGIYCKRIIDNIDDSIEEKKYIDSLVYKSIQQLRVLGSTKLGHDRFKVFDGKKISPDTNRKEFYKLLFKSFITSIASCKVLLYEDPIKHTYNFDNQAHLSDYDTNNIQNLECISNGTYEINEIRTRLITLIRKKESYCDICERNHENENPFLTVDDESNIYFHCRRSKGKILLYCNKEKFKSPQYIDMHEFFGK